MLPTLASLPIKVLDIDIRSDGDWTRVYSLLQDLPDLRSINVEFRAAGDENYSADWVPFSRIRQVLQEKGIEMTIGLERRSADDDPPIDDLMTCLQEMQEYIIHLDCRLPYTRFDPFSAYQTSLPIVMTKCTRIKWTLCEEAGEEFLGSESLAFAAVMARIAGPAVEQLEVAFSTPFTSFIPDITGALGRGAYPRLQSIEGCLSGMDWENDAHQYRREMLTNACRERGITLDKLIW